MGIVESTYAELKQQELKNNSYSCLHMADIDINPHQVEAFTFALSSLELGGAILADEVGLGKTIEAGLVIKYLLCSGKNKILLIMPSNLRKQWQVELEEKFDIDSLIVDSSNWEDYLAKVRSKQAVIIVSYHFASKRKAEFGKIAWDFCVFDEAHRLRNVYKNGSKMANSLYELTKGIPKILLTATPMQNTLLDIYGLVQFIDDRVFYSKQIFSERYLRGEDYNDLKACLEPVVQRTLRKEVADYIQFSERKEMTIDFELSPMEIELYVMINNYLKKEILYALPNSHRTLITSVIRKLLASSSMAVAETFKVLKGRLETLKETTRTESADESIDFFLSFFDDDEIETDDDSKQDELYTREKERISIGFWVGGNVTPNKFSEYSDSDQFKKKEFIRKLTKQIIKCPYCGKEITRDEYDINEKGKYVKIHCADKNCMFSLKTGRTIPVYLVDEEIYAKCPTVIISTVDKFARLPWSERVGLLFGRTDRYCSRCGHIAIGEKHAGRHNADVAAGLERAETVACKPFYPPELIIQDELHLITGPLGTIYGGYETVVEEMCCIEKNGKKIRPKYIVSTATIRNAGEQIKFLYGRNEFAQFPPSGFDTRDSFFIKEVPLPTENLVDASEEKISRMISDGKKPFRQYAGICASGQSVKTTLIRLYSIILQTALDIAKNPEYEDYIDPYYTLIGYFNSIRELGGAVRLLDDDIASRIRVVKNKYNSSEQRYLSFEGKKEITSRIPSWEIAQVLEKLAISYDKNKEKQGCYDVVIATNMIAVGMDVDRLGLMSVVGQPKQNSEYIQATSRVGRQHPGIIFTVYNPYRPRDLSNYENFVGFHSQMYRYVEGTTATPFAARARDRVLHALVVSLLRLQVETMADNGGASNINDISDEQIKDIKDKILERVKITAPSSYVDTEKEMDEFINTWKNIAKDEKLYYFVPTIADYKKRLLTYYGEYYGDKEKPTLSSMRDVEQSSTVFYWEGV